MCVCMQVYECMNNLGSESRIMLQVKDEHDTATIYYMYVYVMCLWTWKNFSLGGFNYFILEFKMALRVIDFWCGIKSACHFHLWCHQTSWLHSRDPCLGFSNLLVS